MTSLSRERENFGSPFFFTGGIGFNEDEKLLVEGDNP